jgi:hypothetical protein
VSNMRTISARGEAARTGTLATDDVAIANASRTKRCDIIG